MQDSNTDEGETTFLTSESSTSQKTLTPEKNQNRAIQIAELKSKTKCKACGKVGHWVKDSVYSKNKKEGSNDKPEKVQCKITETTKSEAHTAVSKEFDEDNASAFMVHAGGYLMSDNGWFLDGGTTDHMTDCLD